MRHAGNFSPEWGYLAPAPSFLHTARIALVAVAVGATASAAVVFSLLDRPEADESVAARTLVPANVASAAATAPAKVAAVPAAGEQAASAPHPVAAKAALAQPKVPPLANAPKGSTANDSGTTSTTQHSVSVAVLAESPQIADLPAQPGIQAPLGADGAAQNAAAQKKPVARPSRFPRGPLALLRSFGFRGEN